MVDEPPSDIISRAGLLIRSDSRQVVCYADITYQVDSRNCQIDIIPKWYD